jgi:hypothetical protein
LIALGGEAVPLEIEDFVFNFQVSLFKIDLTCFRLFKGNPDSTFEPGVKDFVFNSRAMSR